MLVKVLAFTSAYFLESGLFNGLQPIQIRFSPAFEHLTVVKCASAAPYLRGRGRQAFGNEASSEDDIDDFPFEQGNVGPPAFTVGGLF